MTIERKCGLWDAGNEMWDMGNKKWGFIMLTSHFPHDILIQTIEFFPEKWEMGIKWGFSWLKCGPLVRKYFDSNLAQIFIFRLYYLFEGPNKIKLIGEATFVNTILWTGPLISGLIQTMHVAENFILFGDSPFLFHYSYCAKSHFIPSVSADLTILKIALSLTVPREPI